MTTILLYTYIIRTRDRSDVDNISQYLRKKNQKLRFFSDLNKNIDFHKLATNRRKYMFIEAL